MIPEPEVQIALIAAIGSVFVAGVSAVASIITMQLSRRIRTQVENDQGSKNMRHDLDDIKGDGQIIMKMVADMSERLTNITSRHDAEHKRLWNALAKTKGKKNV